MDLEQRISLDTNNSYIIKTSSSVECATSHMNLNHMTI